MKQQFLDLVAIALGSNPLPEQMSENIGDLARVVQELNEQLGLTKELERFVHIDKQGRFLRAPVPFVSSGSPVKVTILGLNPKLDHKLELYQGSWDGYADIHSSPELHVDHALRKVCQMMGPYYQKVALLVTALTQGVFMSWSKPRPDDREKRFLKLITENPICVAELIPFHSDNIVVSKERILSLLARSDWYKRYLTELLDVIDDHLDSDGWMVCNGVGPCAAFEYLVGSDFRCEYHNEEKRYSLGKWKGRKVILFIHFFRTQSLPLNSFREIREMFRQVHSHFGIKGWTEIRVDYRAYVNQALHVYLNVPSVLIEDYESWRCRSFLGCYLCHLGKYKEAIHVLQSVDDAVRSEDPRAIEDRIWCLQYLGTAVSIVEKKGQENALQYIEEALRLIDGTDQEFDCVVRGNVWYSRLKILRGMGRVDEALRDAEKKIASCAQHHVINDSYLYYSYRFIAEAALARGKYMAAVEQMKQALDHFPKEYPDMDEIEVIWAERFADPTKTYVKLEALTHHEGIVGFDRHDRDLS